jgi:large subunit ribosomal protein L2
MVYLKYLSKKNIITTYPKIKKLLLNKPCDGGHNNSGYYVFRRRGGGVKRLIRFVDFKHIIWETPVYIMHSEYDPNRSALINLVCYFNGILSYVLSTLGSSYKQKLFNTSFPKLFKIGNTMLLHSVNEGSFVHSLETCIGFGGKYARAAGTNCILLKKFSFVHFLIRLPSKEEIFLDAKNICTLGRVSNINHKLFKKYKAGQNRLKGKKFVVRGVARNPVDHPHGGAGGKCQVTLWAKIAKNHPTKKNSRLFETNKIFVVLSRKKIKKKKRK